MISFIQFLKRKEILEAFDSELFLSQQTTPAELFISRSQPFHSGHATIIKMMKNYPIIAIVKGAKSSLDKEKNPLPFSYQEDLIKKVFPNIEILEVPTGYLPDIINQIRVEGKEVKQMFAGEDRIAGYQSQINSFNNKEGIKGTNKEIHVQFIKTPRITSATLVRQSIKDFLNAKTKADSDKALAIYKDNMPKELWDEIDNIGKYIKEEIENPVTTNNIINIDKPIEHIIKHDNSLSDYAKDTSKWKKENKVYKKRIKSLE